MANPRNNRIGGNPAQGQHGAKGIGRAGPDTLDEFDLADELKGDNDLRGEDQLNAPSERQEQAGAKGETDELLESFKKADKRYRAGSEELDRQEAARAARKGKPQP